MLSNPLRDDGLKEIAESSQPDAIIKYFDELRSRERAKPLQLSVEEQLVDIITDNHRHANHFEDEAEVVMLIDVCCIGH